MVSYKTLLHNQRQERLDKLEQEHSLGLLPDRGRGQNGFVVAYNALRLTERPFAYDQGRDQFLYDGREMTGGALAELRSVCAKTAASARGRGGSGLRTVKDAARALCAANKVNPAPGLPWQAEITELLENAVTNGDLELLRTITIRGVPFQFVVERPFKNALGVHGARAMTQVRAAMHALGWHARPALVYGIRRRGFARKAL